MDFALLATITSLATLLLAIGWIFFGSAMIRRWGAQPNEIALVIGRRIGVVYLCVSLLYGVARAATAPELTNMLSLFGMLANALLASVGIYEFLKRRIGPAIFVSIALEVVLAIGFARLVFM
jgi:hypothetical protein